MAMDIRTYVESVARLIAARVGNTFHITSPVPVRHEFMTSVAEHYMTTEHDDSFSTLGAWQQLGAHIDHQYSLLAHRIEFAFVDFDPITSLTEITEHVNAGQLPVWHSVHTGGHPLWSDDQNNRFRAVHDVMGHYLNRVGFDAYGEDAAYRSHALTLPRHLAPILAVETRGQNAALNYGDPIGEFKEQKCFIAPDWMVYG